LPSRRRTRIPALQARPWRGPNPSRRCKRRSWTDTTFVSSAITPQLLCAEASFDRSRSAGKVRIRGCETHGRLPGVEGGTEVTRGADCPSRAIPILQPHRAAERPEIILREGSACAPRNPRFVRGPRNPLRIAQVGLRRRSGSGPSARVALLHLPGKEDEVFALPAGQEGQEGVRSWVKEGVRSKRGSGLVFQHQTSSKILAIRLTLA
jgi:hypothetical protein